MKKSAFIVVLLLIFNSADVWACSACALWRDGKMVVGKNLDWFCPYAQVIVNKRGITKRAFVQDDEKPLTWTARYGSVTFNSTGVGSPGGGMNEAGLVIEESSLNATRYPAPDSRKAIDEIQWIQYQLDNFKTVDEVIASTKTVRMRSFYYVSHYFVYDTNGNALTLDAIDGELVFHKIPKEGVQVLTNNTYNVGMDALKQRKGFGGDNDVVTAPNSIDRFCKAADMVRQYRNGDTTGMVNYTFNILKTISQPATTWSVVYDISNRTVYYRTATSPQIKKIPFADIDFNCSKPGLVLDVNIQKGGNVVTDFIPFTTEGNKAFVKKVIDDWHKNKFAMQITEEEIKRLGEFPGTWMCAK